MYRWRSEARGQSILPPPSVGLMNGATRGSCRTVGIGDLTEESFCFALGATMADYITDSQVEEAVAAASGHFWSWPPSRWCMNVIVTKYAPFSFCLQFLLITSPRDISIVDSLDQESGRATAVAKACAELQTGVLVASR